MKIQHRHLLQITSQKSFVYFKHAYTTVGLLQPLQVSSNLHLPSPCKSAQYNRYPKHSRDMSDSFYLGIGTQSDLVEAHVHLVGDVVRKVHSVGRITHGQLVDLSVVNSHRHGRRRDLERNVLRLVRKQRVFGDSPVYVILALDRVCAELVR